MMYEQYRQIVVGLTALVWASVDISAQLPAPLALRSGEAKEVNGEFRVPAHFMENMGQWDPSVSFAGRCGQVLVQIGRDSVRLMGPPDRAGVRPILTLGLAAGPVPEGPRAGVNLGFRCNALVGNDPSRWARRLPALGGVEFHDVMPGVDLQLLLRDGRLDFIWHVRKGAEASPAWLRLPDTAQAQLQADGAVRIEEGKTTWLLTSPIGPVRNPARVASTWKTHSGRLLGLTMEPWELAGEADTTLSASLLWSTYFGGSDIDEIQALAMDADGDVVLVGTTKSTDIPITPGVFDPDIEPTTDGLLARFNSAGDVEFITYLGGPTVDIPTAIDFGPSGSIFLTGYAGAGYPSTPGSYDPFNNGFKTFVTRLSGDGSTLEASTFFGSATSPGFTTTIVAEMSGITIGGHVGSDNLPISVGSFDKTFAGSSESFLARFDAYLSTLQHCTYIGGDGDDILRAMSLGTTGDVVVIGATFSTDFPVTPGAFSDIAPGAFISRLSADGSTLLASTTLPAGDAIQDVAVGPDDSVYVTGNTFTFSSSTGDPFPTTPGAFSTDPFDIPCGFVTRFTPQLDDLIYSTYLSSFSDTILHAIEVDHSGVATVAGDTVGQGYQTTKGSLFPDKIGAYDVVLTRLLPDGSGLLYSTYFGGTSLEGLDVPVRLVQDAMGRVVVATETYSSDLPVTGGAFDPTLDGPLDLLLASLELLPAGVVPHGSSTAGCTGPLVMGVQNAPFLGATDFALTCSGAPRASAEGLLLLSLAELQQPYQVKQASLWVDPTLLMVIAPLKSDGLGFVLRRQPLPAAPQLAGKSFVAQILWPDGCAPGGLAASNALKVTLQ
jgi:hypothetical protein